MFAKNLITLSFLILFQICCSSVIKDDKYLHLFIADHNSTEAAPPVTGAPEGNGTTAAPTRTTYNWGQWTKTQAPGSQTTYDWGQWTDPSRTTYDWGQWTKTQAPGSRTTYDWGQWTKTRTTYDWGQYTSTSGPNDDNQTSTENPNDQNNRYRCTAGKYACAGTVGMCISLDQVCDGKQNCPHMDDENPKMCYPPFGGQKSKKKNVNSFSGNGFMFHIKNIVIRSGSDVKLFNQQSDNNATDSRMKVINKIGANNETQLF